MRIHCFLATTLSMLLAASLAAQNCSDNTHVITLVDQAGVAAPTSGDPSFAAFADDHVYMALPPSLPSGLYYVHVTDIIGGHDEVLSLNDPADRFVLVTNTAGVITLALPFSSNPNPAFGTGLGGTGQSLPVFPFRSASWDPCRFKAWIGDCWTEPVDPTNPYLLMGGFDAAHGRCCVRSYQRFTVGDGSGPDVSGLVFDDLDGDGARDAGEPGVPGVEVRLVTPSTSQSALTDGNGGYGFANIGGGNYSVELTVPAGWNATTPTSQAITVSGCGDTRVRPFGIARQAAQNCAGLTIGFWGNRHGLALVQSLGLLAVYPGLCLVNGQGQYVTFANLDQYKAWLQAANAVNMAYMLSAQLVAMNNNVAAGNVGAGCRINDPQFGSTTIQDLIAQARASLCAHPYTPSGSPYRAEQERIKNALDRANNNTNWL